MPSRASRSSRAARRRSAATTLLLALAGLTIDPCSAHAQRWAWEEILTTQRGSSRLTSLAIDVVDPTRLYVGTEEGTVLVSEDGGVTFDERSLSARRVVGQSVSTMTIVDFAQVPPGQLGTRTREYQLYADPPYAWLPSSRADLPFDWLIDWNRPSFINVETAYGSGGLAVPSPLGQLAAAREREVDPVVHVMSCPGATFPLIALTRRGVHASDDHGLSFVTVFTAGSAEIRTGRCDTSQRGMPRMVVGTNAGVYESRDGGATFVAMNAGAITVDWGIGAMMFGADGDLYMGTGNLLLEVAGATGELSLLHAFEDILAPRTPINVVLPVPPSSVFVGSDDGLRVIRDERIEIVQPEIFDGMSVRDMTFTVEAQQRTLYVLARRCGRIGVPASCRDSRVFASTDDGATWVEVLEGASRHVILGVWTDAQRSALYAIAANGIVTSRGPHDAGGAIDPEIQQWARLQLASSPPLDDVVEHVLLRHGLDPESIDNLIPTSIARQAIPLLNVVFNATLVDQTRGLVGLPSGTLIDEQVQRLEVGVFAQLSWNWGFDPQAFRNPDPGPGDIGLLIELRRNITTALEDAWHERRRRLNDLSRGVQDPLRALVLVERVDTLGAVVESFLDGPLVEIEPEAGEE